MDHEGPDGKGRERMDCWIYLKRIMRGRLGLVEKDRTAGLFEVDHEGQDLPEGDHEGQDGKGREGKDCWIYLKRIIRGRRGKVEKGRIAGFIDVDHEGLDLPEGDH